MSAAILCTQQLCFLQNARGTISTVQLLAGMAWHQYLPSTNESTWHERDEGLSARYLSGPWTRAAGGVVSSDPQWRVKGEHVLTAT